MIKRMTLAEMAEETLNANAKEYSFSNRFDNFLLASELTEQSPEMCLFGMALKHYVSVVDIEEGRLKPCYSVLREKFGDAYNYTCLLRAMLLRKQEIVVNKYEGNNMSINDLINELIYHIKGNKVYKTIKTCDRLCHTLEEAFKYWSSQHE